MSSNQQDFRARGAERPLLPRLLRHPVQTPHIPAKVISLAFLAAIAIVAMVGLMYACKYKTKRQFSLKIFVKILATLACAASIGFGIKVYFENELYDMGQNALIASAGVLCAAVLLI